MSSCGLALPLTRYTCPNRLWRSWSRHFKGYSPGTLTPHTEQLIYAACAGSHLMALSATLPYGIKRAEIQRHTGGTAGTDLRHMLMMEMHYEAVLHPILDCPCNLVANLAA